MKEKPTVVYFHRYPLKDEAIQAPLALPFIDELLKKNDVLYYSMRGKEPQKYKEVRFNIIPISIDRTKTFDKWFKTLFYYFYLPIALFKLWRLKPDLIIAKEPLPFIPMLIAMLGFPTLIDVSDWWWMALFGKTNIGKGIAKFLETWEIRSWNRKNVMVVAHTKTEAEMVHLKGLSMDKIEIVNACGPKLTYCPISSKKLKNRLFKRDWVVSVHGIIHPNKDYPQILDWWNKLVQIHPNWKLLMIGGAGLGINEVKDKINVLSLWDNVTMTGWLKTEKEVNEYLNVSDCLLVTRRNTSDSQGIMPSSLYHNMMIGKPTLATGLKGISEIITHGKDGYLFKPDNYESFKSALEYIHDNPKAAAIVARQGIKRAKYCFDPDRAAKGYTDIVNHMIYQKSNTILQDHKINALKE